MSLNFVLSELIELTGTTKPENMKFKLIVEASQRVDDFSGGEGIFSSTVVKIANN